MADYFTCRLTFPTAALDIAAIREEITRSTDNTPEEIATAKAGGSNKYDNASVISAQFGNPHLIEIEDLRARYGEIEDLEKALFEHGIPYDASSEGYLEYAPEHRYWREGMKEPARQSVTENGDAYLEAEAIRAALKEDDPLTAIKALLDREAPDVVPLEQVVEATAA